MSKGNLFLGYARGKVGDVVFSRQNGEQVARARNRSPRNPQSPLQMVQRVCLKTASLAYSQLQDLCNHSFQGMPEGTPCQSRFMRLNIDAMRMQLAQVINSGDPEEILFSTEANFNAAADSLPALRDYIISEGTLPEIYGGIIGPSATPCWGVSGPAPTRVTPADAEISYADVCAHFGLQRGDQLTFVILGIDDSATGAEKYQTTLLDYARVILEPAGGDMSVKFASAGHINDPNPRNEGTMGFMCIFEGMTSYKNFYGIQPQSYVIDSTAGTTATLAAIGCIASRLTGGVWQRSPCRLAVRDAAVASTLPFDIDHEIGYLGDAIHSYLTDSTSTLYLNQAE